MPTNAVSEGTENELEAIAVSLKKDLAVYRLALRHPRTPRGAKVLLGAAVGYFILPFDVIPDWIPVLGHLDDLIIVPLLIVAALRHIPEDVIRECQEAVDRSI